MSATMVEDSGLDIMSLNKYCNSSSSSSSSEHDKKFFSKLKLNLSVDFPQKNAEILSGQYGTNLLLVGIALMLGNATHNPLIKEEYLLSFLTSLMILQLIWMMWYILVQKRQKNAPTEKDAHATTGWIRGGLTLLALLTLIMDAFRVGYYVGEDACASPVLAVYPVIHATHTIAQVHFLWFHIKDVIKSFKTFDRFGVMHAVFTNLILWCHGVMSETEHFMNNRMRGLTALGFTNLTIALDPEPICNCTTSTCNMFFNSLAYLYPFNIEYHIFVSAMLFVMWKNIGRTIEHSNQKKVATKNHCLTIGPVMGLLALASTIGVLVVYVTHMESLQTRLSAISMFYIYGIVILALMCFAGAAGLLIYRVDHMPMDTSKNPSRQLDTELLFGSSVGSWLMAWCSIVAVLNTSNDPPYRWMNFTYSVLTVLEKYIQNVFIIESLYRQKEDGEREDPELTTSPEVFTVTSSLASPYNGIINQAYETPERPCVSFDNEQEDSKRVCGSLSKPLEVSLPRENKVVEPLKVKKQVLKNVAIFLILCNMSLWILPAFGCRPQYDNGLEQELYGFNVWTTVLNFVIPLNLFYRMHSVASLFEVFRQV